MYKIGDKITLVEKIEDDRLQDATWIKLPEMDKIYKIRDIIQSPVSGQYGFLLVEIVNRKHNGYEPTFWHALFRKVDEQFATDIIANIESTFIEHKLVLTNKQK